MFLYQNQSSLANNKVILFVETLIDKVRLRESETELVPHVRN